MTVKMASAKCLVFLVTLVMAQCVPLDFTTSRYKEGNIELNENIPTTLSLSLKTKEVPQIFDIFPSYHNSNISLLTETFINFIDNTSFPLSTFEPESRKFNTKKNTNLYSNFEKNTIKNNTKLNSNNSLYTNFQTQKTFEILGGNTSKKPGVFQIQVRKATTPKPLKFFNITNKPIIINLTRVPSNFVNPFKVTKPTVKTTRTPGWISMIKSTTPTPTKSHTNKVTTKSSTKSSKTNPTRKTTKTPGWVSKIKSTAPTPIKNNTPGWPNNKIKNKNDWNRYKNYTQLETTKTQTSTVKRKQTKPTRVKYVPKPGHKPTIEEIKQNWYESGVPYPNPMPEISSNVPTFSIPDSDPEMGEDLDSVQVDAAPEVPLSNPISTFDLDMRPAVTNTKDTVGGSASGCPTVHISSSVLSPQQRQGCSDLNLVINSHFHQNTASDRTPTIDTYQAGNAEEEVPVDVAADPAEEIADPGLADPGPANPGLADAGGALSDPGAVQADSAGGGSPGAGGTGGSGANGGNGGNGGDGSDSGLGWPDIKGILDAVDWFGSKFGGILRFLTNPYLYLIPATLFFLLGFFLIIALFPWWVPLLFLFVGIKAKHKTNLVQHKHVHKAVHHPDGWFWNHHTKTWENVADYLHKKRIDHVNLNHIPKAINQFEKKLGIDNKNVKLIKRITSGNRR